MWQRKLAEMGEICSRQIDRQQTRVCNFPFPIPGIKQLDNFGKGAQLKKEKQEEEKQK